MTVRSLLLLLAAVVGGTLFGLLALKDPGYVLISYGNRTFETSVWFALFCVLILMGAVALAWALLRHALRSRSQVSAWARERRLRNANTQTVQGAIQLTEGQFAAARSALEGAAEEVETPVLNYLAAAVAAYSLGDAEEGDRLLERAETAAPRARTAVGLTRARLQGETGQWQRCRETLDLLLSENPRHPRVLGQSLECAERLQDWAAVVDLVARAKKAKGADTETLERALRNAWRGRLAASRGSDAAAEHARQTWKSVPKNLKRDPALVHAYAVTLMAAGDADTAESVLRSAIGADFDPDLVELYGRVRARRPDRQFDTAKGWLAAHPDDATLLLALGRLAAANEDSGSAREYLEFSIAQSPSAAARAELGRVYLAEGDVARGRQLLDTAFLDSMPSAPAGMH